CRNQDTRYVMKPCVWCGESLVSFHMHTRKEVCSLSLRQYLQYLGRHIYNTSSLCSFQPPHIYIYIHTTYTHLCLEQEGEVDHDVLRAALAELEQAAAHL